MESYKEKLSKEKAKSKRYAASNARYRADITQLNKQRRLRDKFISLLADELRTQWNPVWRSEKIS